LYESRTKKPVEIILSENEGDRMMEGMNPTKVHCKHIWKYDDESPQYNKYMLINIFQTKQTQRPETLTGRGA
jgi:hypothetical protein